MDIEDSVDNKKGKRILHRNNKLVPQTIDSIEDVSESNRSSQDEPIEFSQN